MSSYDRLYKLLIEGAGQGEQRGRAHLSRLPSTRTTRHRGFGLGSGPHGGHDSGEGTSKDVRVTLARLKSALKMPTLTGIQRAQIQSHYDRLSGDKA